MGKLLFGTGGAPWSSASRSTVDGIKRIAELGLGCMEIEFVEGVNVRDLVARQIANVAANRNIKLSVHAPYFINLNSHEPEKVKASQERILHSARAGALCGATEVIFHAAFYMGDPVETVYANVKKCMIEILEQMDKENLHMTLRPEVMGKITQFGSLEELFQLSIELPNVAPCLDLAHWHARTGKYNSYYEFVSIFALVKKRLGEKALDRLHIHLTGIDFGTGGEKKHLNLNDSDMEYQELLNALLEYNVGGLLICESPNLEEDALMLQQIYSNMLRKI
jgi:deoxyribonuclease IV